MEGKSTNVPRRLGKYIGKLGLVTYFYFYFTIYLGRINPAIVEDPSVVQGFHLYGGVVLISAVAVFYRPWTAVTGLFLGEFLVQAVAYGSFSFLLVVPSIPFAIFTGLPRYEKRKYLEGSKLVNLSFYNLVASLVSMGLYYWILWALVGSISDELLFSMLYYFLGIFVSSFFLGALLVYGFERFTAYDELYAEILTHHPPSMSDHAFGIVINGSKIYFCSRCSGMVVGALALSFLSNFVDLSTSQEFIFWACVVIPAPSLVDWGTQKLGLRTSNTPTRLVSGASIGMAMYFLSHVRGEYRFKVLGVVLVYFTVFFFLFFFGARMRQKKLNRVLDALEAGPGVPRDPYDEEPLQTEE
ncbi:MAG: DUF2085 domain-containing protein [Promethearchaeota archaeon]